mmetsp:Transcript_93649/g.264316  ORF Transcript_93649/g.264316 Transcript_93649/m.264316 type:complete len:304 (-) Transcript_93649:191-1102(-)
MCGAEQPRMTPAKKVASRHGSAGRRATTAGAGVLLGAAALVLLRASAPCWLSPSPASSATHRRGALTAALGAALAISVEPPAEAFDNAIKIIRRDANDRKKKGPQPTEIGLEPRKFLENALGMKECTDKTPNCFSTTGVEGLDAGFHLVSPWQFSGKLPKAALEEVRDVILTYPPGQQGIDGGGFSFIAEEQNCIYFQFESLKRGHLDDVEFCIEPGTNMEGNSGNMLLRSSSRQGFWDFGVNAVRLNWISDAMRKKGGWKADEITQITHPIYWGANCQGGETRKAPFSVREAFPKYCPESPA